jgi:DNA repair photolyase
MKYAEIKYQLVKKGFPPYKIQTEIEKIQRSAEKIAKDAKVPVKIITKMILENIKHVGDNSGT